MTSQSDFSLKFGLLLFCLAAVSGLVHAQDAKSKHELEVPFVASTDEAVDAMLKLAAVTRDDVVYDLGCGDGRIVIAAATKFGARGVGIDLDPVRISEANQRAAKAGVQGLVRFEEADLFQADLHEATVVTLFLLPEINAQLRPKLLRELKPGARIVSNTFEMWGWNPDKRAAVGNQMNEPGLSHRLYLWFVPSRNRP